jgi:hypothetical protein
MFKEFFMKKALKALGIIALVAAIGVLAVSCDEPNGGGINGTWGNDYYSFRISGSEGTFTSIGGGWSYTSVRIGNQKFRNIRQTSNYEWSASELLYNTSTYYTSWYSCTLTLSANGKTLTVYNSSSSSRYTDYYRR